MKRLKIVGQTPISGEVTISGNKNAALPMIAACLLTDECVTLHNMPDILDVRSMLDIIQEFGAEVEFKNNSAKITAKDIKVTEISREACSNTRTSILFAAPLVARFGSARLYPPGGDVIGRRRLDGHFYGLQKLGAKANYGSQYSFEARGLTGCEMFLDEASVTATEQIMMAAVIADGVTILRNAASEPHVVDLGELLNQMGAKISGLGSNTLEIEGVKKLHGVEYKVCGDHIEAGSFLALAAARGGELTVRGTTPRNYWMIRRVFEKFNIKMELHPDYIYLPGGQDLKVSSDMGGHIPVISDGPWPQFPSDMMSCTIVMATQAQGTCMFFEKMFESRIYFVDRLIAMGASAIVCDPHRVVINGATILRGTTLHSPDIRAGMALLIAAVCAHGECVINSCEVIYRGYENLVEKLQAIGCNIEEI